MESTCSKTLKLQSFLKFLVKGVKQGPLYDYIFFKTVSQSNISRSTTIETSTLPAIYIFKRSNLIFQLIFQNSGIFISFVTSLSPNWVKRTQSCISCIEGDRKIEMIIWWNFEGRSLFLRSFSQKIAGLTPVVTSLTQNWVKKGSNFYSMNQWW